MKLTSSYSVMFKDGYSAVRTTIKKYNEAVKYLLLPVQEHWNQIKTLRNLERQQYVEHLIHGTENRKAVYDFDQRFYKFPSYLRRSAIMDAIGTWSAYQSSLQKWKDDGGHGKQPKCDHCTHLMPCFYNKVMFRYTDDAYTAQIKVYRNRDWVWQLIRLNKSDMDYLTKRSRYSDKVSAPVVVKKHGHYELRFTAFDEVTLSDKPIYDQKVCAVDLGINTDATCCVMDAHGTILSRKFINCGKETDQVNKALHRVSVFQRLHGSHDSGRLWNIAKRQNLNHAHQIANRIVDYAYSNGCDVIVFEHLNTRGKKHGSGKQKLAMWCNADVQNTAVRLAHMFGMRIAHVNAWNTSRLAYDGSGTVKRGHAVNESTPYDVCMFQNGKMYNCDLSASYNIGARYIIRTLLTELPHLQAEVPAVGSGTRRTLSTLWQIDHYLYA